MLSNQSDVQVLGQTKTQLVCFCQGYHTSTETRTSLRQPTQSGAVPMASSINAVCLSTTNGCR